VRRPRCRVDQKEARRVRPPAKVEPPSAPAIGALKAVRAALVAVLPARHALARLPSLELAQLAGEDFIFLKQQSEPQICEHFRSHCARAGFEPNVIVQVEHVEPLLSFVAAGVGVSCVPSLVERLPFRGVKTRPLVPEVRGGISAAWRHVGLSATAARFLEVLRAELASAD
jgi:DNA-binding transcriptional LysR family regulator